MINLLHIVAALAVWLAVSVVAAPFVVELLLSDSDADDEACDCAACVFADEMHRRGAQVDEDPA